MKDIMSEEEIKQLEEKLEKLKAEQAKKEIPQVQENIDWQKLINLCVEYRDYVNSEDFHEDNDFDHYIYEEALITIFGKSFWNWYNKRI